MAAAAKRTSVRNGAAWLEDKERREAASRTVRSSCGIPTPTAEGGGTDLYQPIVTNVHSCTLARESSHRINVFNQFYAACSGSTLIPTSIPFKKSSPWPFNLAVRVCTRLQGGLLETKQSFVSGLRSAGWSHRKTTFWLLRRKISPFIKDWFTQ